MIAQVEIPIVELLPTELPLVGIQGGGDDFVQSGNAPTPPSETFYILDNLGNTITDNLGNRITFN